MRGPPAESKKGRTLVGAAGHRGERAICGRGSIALRVVERDGRDFAAAPDDECTDGGKDDANDEQRRQHGFRCQDGLPSLQPLLFERGVCQTA